VEFERLEALQRRLQDIKRLQSKSLRQYYATSPKSGLGIGFRHLWNEISSGGKPYSHASTATCIVSLTRTGVWWHAKNSTNDAVWSQDTSSILSHLCRGRPTLWKSAGLNKGNPFTVAFTLEAIKELLKEPSTLSSSVKKRAKTSIVGAETLLVGALKKRRSAQRSPNQFAEVGGAHVDYYPPTSFLTQLVVRAIGIDRLQERRALKDQVEAWCRRQIEHELALLTATASTRDPLALAYALAAFVGLIDTDAISRADAEMVKQAIDRVFDAQLTDGSWPRSRPLHHYPTIGNAYCYEYETLVQLLEQPYLEQLLIGKLEKLEVCIAALGQTANILPNGGKAWASGHHPHLSGAESWSTASVYHFVHALDRLVAEAIRQVTFAHVGAAYTRPCAGASTDVIFKPPDFVDSTLSLDGHEMSLCDAIQDRFLRPILVDMHQVERGERMSKKTPISAIFFGPPGTSKTSLAQLIAQHLGWPRLGIDPSHLFKGGLEQIQSESNRLFNMLATLERTVVFFDEFDEMVRERTSTRADLISRFLTTAMLPKLSRIAEERKIVFLLATNHIEDFDFAISRPGRFDLLLPVMPPSLSAKFAHKKWKGMKARFRGVLAKKSGDGRSYRDILEALTHAEFGALYDATKEISSVSSLQERIEKAWAKATLNKPYGAPKADDAELLVDVYRRQGNDFARAPPPKAD
jgi:AcrR family transcriptional regulator